jgi:hypothetical protein
MTESTKSISLKVPTGSNVTIYNGKVTVNGKIEHMSPSLEYKIILNGEVQFLDCDKSVTIKGSAETISCKGSCNIEGDALGPIQAGGSINITGHHHGARITAGGSVNIG